MDNKSDYLLLAKNVTSIIQSLNSVNSVLEDLTKNFNKGLNSENFNKDTLTKVTADLKAIKNDLNDKVLPELKKKSV